MFKQRSYQDEIKWYFDTKNHTKFDKFELFVRYKLPNVIRPKAMWRLIKRKYYEWYMKYRCEKVYLVSLQSGIDEITVKKGTNVCVQIRFNGIHTFEVNSKVCRTLEEACSEVQVLIDEERRRHGQW